MSLKAISVCLAVLNGNMSHNSRLYIFINHRYTVLQIIGVAAKRTIIIAAKNNK